MTDTSTTQPTVSAPTQPTSPDVTSVTGTTTVVDNTASLQQKINSTPAKASNPCPNSNTSLQTENKPPKNIGFSGDGFGIVEYNSPKVAKTAGVNGGPVAGGPSTNPIYQDIRCGNLLNKQMDFKCSLVAQIKLQSCLFKFQAMFQAYAERAFKLSFSWLQSLLPSSDYAISLKNMICKIANMIQEIMCIIQQVQQCILSTIQYITNLITWVLSLGPALVAQLMSCITSFMSQILNGLSSLTKILGYIFSLIGCQPYQCQAVTSIYDIGNTGSDISSTANSLIDNPTGP
jgi:hypothetical protein